MLALSSPLPRRAARALLALIVAMSLLSLAPVVVGAAAPAQIVKDAACKANPANKVDPTTGADIGVDCSTQGGLAGFVNAANNLTDPALVAMIAVTPLACLTGAGAMMFGSRRGLVIIGSALGTLVFIASIKGIVA